ncbi:hypothetical protein A2U01_0065835, partial [Trifolium medium]|nr:hypothetical protein [Trifolium medium]
MGQSEQELNTTVGIDDNMRYVLFLERLSISSK